MFNLPQVRAHLVILHLIISKFMINFENSVIEICKTYINLYKN